MTKAGADILVAIWAHHRRRHRRGNGADARDCVTLSQAWSDAARKPFARTSIALCHGGPISSPEDAHIF